MKPGQSHKARSRGQINRYKATDLADLQLFWVQFLLVVMINKSDMKMALVIQVHGQIEIN
ncbi:TPA: hypothetical protein I8Z55_000864 [Legionella pneumophila]|nr:hypothetical protein [Legionella pneumophila]HAU1688800.1 hypothetical protein [Legionella pneumophila]